MSKYYCYLCASDEGMLLDTFGDDGKIFRDNIETCLSVKIKRSDVLSSKICHKCVYELDSCSKFLRKYEHSRDLKESRTRLKRGCTLCGENGTKARILEIKKEESLKFLLQKISKVCPGTTFKDKPGSFSICLDCRYNLDVLYDLKTIYNKTLNKLKKIKDEDLALSDLPKLGFTKTSVVSRKTTDKTLPGEHLAVDYNSDASTTSSTMSTASTKRKRGRPRKVSNEISPIQYRSCDECKTCVEHGIDMYRYHRTGLTVCRDCWLTMDPERVKNGKRRKLVKADNEGNTKLCAVFVKDVLSNASPNERAYKIEKDKYGNTTFLITDESEESEEKEKTPPKRLRKRAESVTSVETTTSTIDTKKTTKRAAAMKKNDKEEVPLKKVKTSTTRTSETEKTSVKTRTRNGVVEDTNVPTMRTRRAAVESVEVTKIEAKIDGSKKIATKRLGRPPKAQISKTTSKENKTSSADSSSNEIKVAKQTRARKVIKSTSDVPKMEIVEKTSMRRTRSNSCTSQKDTVPLSVRYKGPSEESVPEKKTPESKPKSTKAKSSITKIAKSDSELEKPYTCSVCQITCKNKLIGKAHELTHEKQPEVKLERVVVPEIIIEEAPAEISSIEDHEEQSHDISSTSDQKNENPDDISSDKDPMKEETNANEEDSIEDEKSPVKKDSIAEEKNDELENDDNEKEADALEITTEKLIVKDTEISKENMSNETNEHTENDENENKENDENENKHDDDNEDKDNDENENKENDDIEIKEKDDSETNENFDDAIEKKDVAENKEKDAVEKRENYDSDNKNDSDTEIIEDDERTESSRITESQEETKDETRQEIEESEKPDSTPNEEIESQMNHSEEPEESPEESKETASDAEDIPEAEETVENKIVAKSEQILSNNVVDSSEKIVETIADSSTTNAAEPSDKIEENTDIDNEEMQITESEKTVDSTVENDNKEQEEEEEEAVTEAEKSVDSTSKNDNEEEEEKEATVTEENEKVEEDVDCGRRKDEEDEAVTESEKTIDSTRENDDEEKLVEEKEEEEEVIMNDKSIDSTKENDEKEVAECEKSIDSTQENGNEEKNVPESEKSIDSTQENGNEEKNVPESEETIEATQKNEDEVESPEVTKNDARFLENSNVNQTETTESANVANSMIHEVFDLASAEVKKRLEKEKPNDNRTSTTPVDETLENISLEVNKTSDMSSSNNDDESIEKLS